MSMEDIRALPVNDLAAENCALFLWITFPQLQEAFSVIQDWGFSYKTVAFVWVKQNRKVPSLFWGLGYWTRANAEVCLLATKGNPKRQSAAVHQVILSPVEQHSKKPDAVRWAMFLVWSCSHGRKPPAGMSGATRSSAVLALCQGWRLRQNMIDKGGTRFLKLTKQ